ncbi:uncharacterized protein BJ212DRAFT_120920 [Suillus subaureus]|uniref:C2H2-type domain-containing protein n=1 Tax=Suillus subaureus TaxID=48587 RepID=A0A9P7ECS5_9AGAM|nr:uncharacterized protein BJ212DRAFT_120920 [Suillus subaureus]KAG1818022.1 hypothetical protein BJ212DRAFT_120920 [Suillus subaureus]
MNANRWSEFSMIHDMLLEQKGVNPILIDQEILRDQNDEVIVHPCNWPGCTMHIGVELKQISKHLQKHHGINISATSEDTQKIPCLWTGCVDARTKPGNLPRHILSHLEVRQICSICGASLSRDDAFRRHTLEKPGCQDAKSVVRYGDKSLVIDKLCIEGGWSASQNVMCVP